MLAKGFSVIVEASKVSVAGCLGYDVLAILGSNTTEHTRFSCWLFRL
ncbi:hypothetical protein [uncultured Gammaproteobacteria bacterium]|nr:hypothetical protein [uncultured Gammaproteobacteria bacterium]CAC9950641.1 hypothetical protein [uncultured Gammaproteobacteria bacterium]CAC9955961.1 hypothetical protein [uncultured Gammaproteobacteria bacterium]